MAIRIISDSTSYIDPVLRQELEIQLVPLSVHFPDESFQEDQVDYDYFYGKIIRENVIPTSSQPSPGELMIPFREAIEAGDAIVAIFISSAMSGTYENALSSRMDLLEAFPDAQIEIIDSRTNCMALGAIVLEAARAAKAGASFDEVVDAAIRARDRVHFFFTPKTLEFLQKGGRIGTASALLGNMLNLSPILTVDMSKGMTHSHANARGSAKATAKIYEILAEDHARYGITAIYVHHISVIDKAKEMQEYLSGLYPNIPIGICNIGPVIGLHVGPGTVGVVYCTDQAKHEIR
ncbi:MAG: DegV family protein [Clostridiales bacterium]|nr:DegV family protein [Clostridiales bacterium]